MRLLAALASAVVAAATVAWLVHDRRPGYCSDDWSRYDEPEDDEGVQPAEAVPCCRFQHPSNVTCPGRVGRIPTAEWMNAGPYFKAPLRWRDRG